MSLSKTSLLLFFAYCSIAVLVFALTSCTPMHLYGETVQRVFDPEYHKQWRQGAPPPAKERVCDKSVC